MTSPLARAIKFEDHQNHKLLEESFKTITEREHLSNIAHLNLDSLRISSKRERDFTTVVLFFERNGKTYFGMGSSKKSRTDKPLALRGVVYAANRALRDLDMELGLRG